MNIFVEKLGGLTGFLIRVVWWLDSVGLLPQSLIDVSPLPREPSHLESRKHPHEPHLPPCV